MHESGGLRDHTVAEKAAGSGGYQNTFVRPPPLARGPSVPVRIFQKQLKKGYSMRVPIMDPASYNLTEKICITA